MIKNGEFCIYNDNEYELNEDSDGNLIIITTNRAIIDETFVDKYNSGVYSKVILPNEIGEAYDCQTYGVIKGSRVNVEKENEEYYFVGTADCKVAGIKKDGRIVLRSEDDASKKEGFVEKEIGNNRIYIKYVQKDEIEEIYDKKTYAVYEGYKFIVVDETEKQILILTMKGDYQEWIRLGMECIDKGMYQKWINKNEAEIEVLKEKI